MSTLTESNVRSFEAFLRFFLCDPLEDKIVYIIQSRSFCASPSCDLDFVSVFSFWA
jgi:hypothetical protein